jgi:hypothetical protein
MRQLTTLETSTQNDYGAATAAHVAERTLSTAFRVTTQVLDSGRASAARHGLSDAVDRAARLQRYQAAIAACGEPEALVDPINQARAERAAQIESVPADSTVSRAEIYARIDALGDVCGTLADATTAGMSRLCFARLVAVPAMQVPSL